MYYKIQEPNHELTEGYLILFIKLLTVFSLGWMLGLLIIYTYPCITWTGNKYPPTLIMLDKYHVFSWIFSFLAIGWYVNRIAKKYHDYLIISFNFHEENQQLTLELLNIYTGKTKTKHLNYNEINLEEEIVTGKLYGIQRVFHFLNDNQPIATLNIDRCAWRKYTDIESLIQKLKELT